MAEQVAITGDAEAESAKDFDSALARDQAPLRKEMGKEGFLEVKRVLKDLAGDPYMLNVRVQYMSDTLIWRLFSRVRDGSEKK